MRRRDAASRRVAPGDLDAALDEAARRFARSEDEGRAYLATIRMDPPPWPADPFSDEYLAWVWDLYRLVSGRPGYDLGNEASPFDLQEALTRPFPFATGSATVVGDDLLARGHLVKALGLAAPARVVEFGPGWGNLTGDLVAMGHDVTAVEVDEGFCRLIAARCPGAHVVHADMLAFAASCGGAGAPSDLGLSAAPSHLAASDHSPPGDGPSDVAPFDAAVFYESFHHCADHVALLEHLHRVVRPGGTVVWGAEPVDVLAYPWGPRLDGLSLWSTRRHGWLELGFDERYFLDALARTGWRATRLAGPTPHATAFVGRQATAVG